MRKCWNYVMKFVEISRRHEMTTRRKLFRNDIYQTALFQQEHARMHAKIIHCAKVKATVIMLFLGTRRADLQTCIYLYICLTVQNKTNNKRNPFIQRNDEWFAVNGIIISLYTYTHVVHIKVVASNEGKASFFALCKAITNRSETKFRIDIAK